jgi:hypothetical protein
MAVAMRSLIKALAYFLALNEPCIFLRRQLPQFLPQRFLKDHALAAMLLRRRFHECKLKRKQGPVS